MTIPQEYIAWRKALGFDEFSFGSGGVRVFPLDELDQGQVGYSRKEDGKSLCDGAEESWKPEWIAIGYETGLGDPIILDTSGHGLAVTTAMHGEGYWEPELIAISLHAFTAALRAMLEVSEGREHPVGLEDNPLPEEERERVLDLIRAANHDEIDMDFWELLLAAE